MATLAYRIISYWLPIAVGPFAYFAFRLRYGKPGQGTGGRAAAGAGGADAGSGVGGRLSERRGLRRAGRGRGAGRRSSAVGGA